MRLLILSVMMCTMLWVGGCVRSPNQAASGDSPEHPKVPLPGQTRSEGPAAAAPADSVPGFSSVPQSDAEVDGVQAAREMMEATGVEFPFPKGFQNKNSVNGSLSFKAKDAETFVVVSVYDEKDSDAVNRKSVEDLVRIKAPLKMVMEPRHEDRGGLSMNTFEMATPNNNYQHLQMAVSNGNKVLVIWAHGNLNNAENKKAVDEMIEGIKKR